MNKVKSGSYFFVSYFGRGICLLIIIGLVCSSSTQTELKSSTRDFGIQPHLENHTDPDQLVDQLNNLQVNSYMWLICGFNSWEDLKIFLPEAKMAGISVGAILIPPYQSPPVNPDCPYSEPFEQDYVRWAEEIAKLSLRYSNLIGYGIDNLQENIELGNLTQTYIDSIITTGKSINPLLQFINSEPPKSYHIWYVDRDASGNGNGESWVNASNTVKDLTWASITGGDTVYISGGEVSKIYPKDKIENKAVTGHPVVVTKGWENGHNGEVVFQQTDPVAINGWERYTFYVRTCENIKITGLTFSTAVSDAYNGRAILKIKQCENVIIDNNSIYSNGNGTAVNINGNPDDPSRKLIITNNYIEVGSHPLDDYPKDCMWIGNNHGGHTITGNTFITHAIWSDDRHPDIIQMYREGSDDNYQMTIANNFMMYDNNTTTHAQSVYMEDMGSNRILYYNNIIVMNGIKNRGFVCDGINESVNLSIRAFNNTHIKDGHSSTLFWATNIDTLIMKNNIFYSDSLVHSMILLGIDSLNEIDYIDVDYNHYYTSEGLEGSNLFRSKWGSSLSWTEWQTLGYDANGDTGSISFTNLWGTDILDYLTTTGRDTGVDLSGYFTTDIRSVIRPQGAAWDKGAVESSSD